MQKPRIILIDDENGILVALKLMLQAMGAEVETFNGGEAGLERLLNGSPFDYVLCDLRMPDVDGLSVLKGFRGANQNTPFILMSGHATQDDVNVAKSLGMTSFLGKPFQPDEIKRVLNLG
jgi:DNA-binding NtrC family response regulator